MIVHMLAAALLSSGLYPHGPTDPIPRCVTAKQRRSRACHCEARNRTPMPDGAWYVLHRGRCVIEGGLGPVSVHPPHVLPPSDHSRHRS